MQMGIIGEVFKYLIVARLKKIRRSTLGAVNLREFSSFVMHSPIVVVAVPHANIRDFNSNMHETFAAMHSIQ